jgi:hypothetical protein
MNTVNALGFDASEILIRYSSHGNLCADGRRLESYFPLSG